MSLQIEKKRRLLYISVSKGIGIILVVTGHVVHGTVGNFIYLFHMPLFFMLTGYLLQNMKDRNFMIFIKAKIQSLYVPYIVTNGIFLIVHNFFFDIGFYADGYLNLHRIIRTKEFLKEIIGILTLTHMEQIAAPTWYIRVLFISCVLYLLMYKILKKEIYVSGICLVFIIGVYVALYIGVTLSSSVFIYTNLVMISLFFLRIGYIYRKVENAGKIKYSWIGIIIAFGILIILNMFFHINVVALKIENPLVFVVASISGMYLVVALGTKIQQLKIGKMLEYIGDRSLAILLLHCFAFKIINLMYAFVNQDKKSLRNIANGNNFIWIVVYILAGIIIPLIIKFVFDYLKRIYRKNERRRNNETTGNA